MRIAPLLLLLAVCAPASGEPADLLVHNGVVLTVDAGFSVVSAFAVRDGRFLAVGGEEITERYEAERVLDLDGAVVMPGFIDSHTHLRGRPRWYVELSDVDSIVAIRDLVRRKADELGPGQWITGYGWSEDELSEGRKPLRADLDLAAPKNPVLLTRAGGHSAVANSAALRLADIDRSTPDPEGGVIERDAAGELNGVIRERQEIVGRLVPEATPEEKRDSFIAVLKDQFRHGITSVIQASEPPAGFEEWRRVYRRLGDELPRAAVQILWPGAAELAALDYKTGDGNERLRVGAVKIFSDGGFTGPAAYTIEPYKGQTDYRGKLNMTEAELETAIRRSHQLGWQLGIHAIGDAAIQLVVDDLVGALEADPRDDHRHYLNHFTVMPPAATMEKMAEYGIAITQQPNFTYTLEGRYRENLDGERLAHNNSLRTPMEYGVFVAISSDILPIGPWTGVYAAVTRKGMSGEVYAPAEALSVEEALTAYTRHGAWLTWEEDEKGSIEVGKLADFIVLDSDPRKVDPKRLLEIEARRTYLAGRLVYERE